MSHHPSVTLGSLCTIGGIYGFLKTKSKPSLVGGLFIGSCYFCSGYLIKENKDYGIQSAFMTSILLSGLMAKRAVVVRSPVPIGMASLGLIGTFYYGRKLYEEIVI
jgi:uncharacterized membrane protein (UPF0136 family)